MNLHRSLVAVVLGLSLGCALAQEKVEPCAGSLQEQSARALPRLADLARQAAEKICSAAKPDANDMAPVVLQFLVASDAELKALGITEAVFPFKAQLEQARETAATGQIQSMRRFPGANPGVWFYDQVPVADAAKCDDAIAKAGRDRVAVASCKEFFDHYVLVYNHAQTAMQRRTAEPVERYIGRMRRDWDDFLTKSRSQTPLELFLNTLYWQRGDEAGRFLSPPALQFIVLHPSVVIERVAQAPEGSRTKDGVLLELVGANWWRRDQWYQPSGASLVAVYSERAGVAGWGPGVAVHFGNKYTIGATSHAGSKGLFFSLDVLELAKDKESMLKKYVGGALPR